MDNDFSEKALKEVMSLEEAAERWGKATDTLRQACIERHIGVEAKKSKRIWLVTKTGMERLYGPEPKNNR